MTTSEWWSGTEIPLEDWRWLQKCNSLPEDKAAKGGIFHVSEWKQIFWTHSLPILSRASIDYVVTVQTPKHRRKEIKKKKTNISQISAKGGVGLNQVAAQYYFWPLQILDKVCHPAVSTFLSLLIESKVCPSPRPRACCTEYSLWATVSNSRSA